MTISTSEHNMERRMLTKEDEASTGSDETEVRREDQDRINKFSQLHQREISLEEELKIKSKEKEDLTDITNELELADLEDEGDEESGGGKNKIPYKIGDSFIMMGLEDVNGMLVKEVEGVEDDVGKLEERLRETRDEMEGLKAQLYRRFGRSINLET